MPNEELRMNPQDFEYDMVEALNISIVEELLNEINPNVTDDVVQKIWNICEGNPWNAAPLYLMMRDTI